MADVGAPTTWRHTRIAIIYDNTVRPDTTGEYCRRALTALGVPVSHYRPSEAADIPPVYTLYLRVDDDQDYVLSDALRPLAYWAIDTHLGYQRRLAWARTADAVFCAQRDGAARMRADGVRNAHWLPLACDPAVHRRIPDTRKEYDVCFVGNTFPGDGDRTALVAALQAEFPGSFVGQAYGDEMARIYSASRLVFNCAVRNDVNMRVFEAAACGSLLVTSDLAENGQDLLFTPGEHLVTYRRREELFPLIRRCLGDEQARERMAEAGMRQAHAHHSYGRRMADLLAVAMQGGDLADKYPVPDPAGGPACAVAGGREPGNGNGSAPCEAAAGPRAARPRALRPLAAYTPRSDAGRPRVSIVIPTFNNLHLTQDCVRSIRGSTGIPYEIIVVDNGSSDGTPRWAQGEGLRVIANPENLGFPGACNQGIRASDGEYILLLNNDTQVAPTWLERLIAHAEADVRVGLVGPSTNFAAGCQRIPAAYASHEEFLAFAEQIARTHAGRSQDATWLIGLCLLVPRRVVDAIGLLDERFGLGNFEDNDYCLRARIAGYRVVWAQDVFIHHEGHQSFRQLGDGFRHLLEENEQRFHAKWDLQRYRQSAATSGDGAEQAWSHLQARRYTEAYDAFEAWVRAHPQDARALVGLGLAAEGRGVAAAARLAYGAALALAPGDADATRGLARVNGSGPGLPEAPPRPHLGPATGTPSEAPPGYYEHARPDVQAMVPADARLVLDVGCGAGRLGAALKAAGRRVIGIELDPAQAARARTCLDEVLVGDVETMALPFPAGTFDCIVCADVLEHLRNPWQFLARCRQLLKPEGSLVASIPNVQFIGVLGELAKGRFTYRPAGILDRTHLRFFTKTEFDHGLRTAGFAARVWKPIVPPNLERLARNADASPVNLDVECLAIRGVAPEALEGFLAMQYLVAADPVPGVGGAADRDLAADGEHVSASIGRAGQASDGTRNAPPESAATGASAETPAPARSNVGAASEPPCTDEVERCTHAGYAALQRQAWGDAGEMFLRALERNAEHAPARSGLGLALVSLGDDEEGVAQLREAVRLTPDPDWVCNLASGLIHLGREGDAERLLRGILAVVPGHAAAQENLRALLAVRDDAEATSARPANAYAGRVPTPGVGVAATQCADAEKERNAVQVTDDSVCTHG
jgi:GT2 family glycosyltransferase/SAM-dependent methyltransferase